jgi:hypothetical protein
MPMRLIAFFFLCFNGALACADVSCEQLATIAAVTEKLRNEGQPLAVVLAEADGMQASGRFTAADMTLVRVVIEASFRREQTPNEILVECRARR